MEQFVKFISLNNDSANNTESKQSMAIFKSLNKDGSLLMGLNHDATDPTLTSGHKHFHIPEPPAHFQDVTIIKLEMNSSADNILEYNRGSTTVNWLDHEDYRVH